MAKGRVAWFLFVFFAVGIVSCAPLFKRRSEKPVLLIERQSTVSQQCGIEGNPDFYGLGIRIGIYLQWITALLANLFSKESIGGNLETNTIFLLALYVAIAVATAQNSVQTAELVVLLQLGFGFLFSILSIWGHRTRARTGEQPIRFPLLGAFFRLTLATALSAYALWFWLVGLPIHRSRPEECRDYTFMFAKVDVSGGIGIFFKIQTVIVTVAYGILFARELAMIVCFFLLVSAWTSILAAVTVGFGARQILDMKKREFRRRKVLKGEMTPEEAKARTQENLIKDFFTLIKQWIRISTAVIWKRANGKESAGRNRPDLSLYLVPFLDFWIFFFRTLLQFLCILVFDWCPPIAIPPLIPHPILESVLQPRTFKIKQKIKEWYSSVYTQYITWTVNIVCIIFTIISVELTLIWNNIRGIYDVRSTGQLIPFIIGIVGFLRLLHEVSVHNSATRSTEVIMELLDLNTPETEPSQSTEASSSSRCESENDLHEETWSLHDGTETVFWERMPKRRHSIGVIQQEHILEDSGSKALENGPEVPASERHLLFRFDQDRLEEIYGKDGVEVHSTNQGWELLIVKDFRRYHRRTSSSSDSSGSSYSSRSSRADSSNSSLSRSRSRSRSQDSTPTDGTSFSSSRLAGGSNPARPLGDDSRSNQSLSRSNASASNWQTFRRSRSADSYGRSRRSYKLDGHSPASRSGGQRGRRLSPDSPRHNRSESTSASRLDSSKLGTKTKWAIACVGICLWCATFPVRKLCKWIWKRYRERLSKAGKRFGERLWAHYKARFEEISGENFDDDNSKTPSSVHESPKVKELLPHCRKTERKYARNRKLAADLGAGFKSRSIKKLVPALTDAGQQFLTFAHMPKSAAMVKRFGELFREAENIRKQKLNHEIGRTVQHELLAEKWHSLWPAEGFWNTIISDMQSRPEPKKWKKWEIDSGEELRRWFSWGVTDVYGARVGSEEARSPEGNASPAGNL